MCQTTAKITGIAHTCNFCEEEMGPLDILRSYEHTQTCTKCRRVLHVFLSNVNDKRLLVWRGEETNGEFIGRAREMAGDDARLYPALHPAAAPG